MFVDRQRDSARSSFLSMEERLFAFLLAPLPDRMSRPDRHTRQAVRRSASSTEWRSGSHPLPVPAASSTRIQRTPRRGSPRSNSRHFKPTVLFVAMWFVIRTDRFLFRRIMSVFKILLLGWGNRCLPNLPTRTLFCPAHLAAPPPLPDQRIFPLGPRRDSGRSSYLTSDPNPRTTAPARVPFCPHPGPPPSSNRPAKLFRRAIRSRASSSPPSFSGGWRSDPAAPCCPLLEPSRQLSGWRTDPSLVPAKLLTMAIQPGRAVGRPSVSPNQGALSRPSDHTRMPPPAHAARAHPPPSAHTGFETARLAEVAFELFRHGWMAQAGPVAPNDKCLLFQNRRHSLEKWMWFSANGEAAGEKQEVSRRSKEVPGGKRKCLGDGNKSSPANF